MANDDNRELLDRLAACPEAGTVWVHSKSGNKYMVVCCALREADKEPLVVYQRMAWGPQPAWCRPLSEWLETVEVDGRQVARFQPVDAKNCPRCAGSYTEKVEGVRRCTNCKHRRDV